MPLIAIALALSFVVHDVELTHQHPFVPNVHTHEQGGHHPEQTDTSSVSVYTHGDRKDFLSLLLLISAIPAAALLQSLLPRALATRRRPLLHSEAFDYHRLLFRKGILNSKRY